VHSRRGLLSFNINKASRSSDDTTVPFNVQPARDQRRGS
jgi:hypothetical protein